MPNDISTQHGITVGDIPLDRIDVSNPQLFYKNTVGEYFARLRKEDPVHYCKDSAFGSYWSVTKHKDIMHVDINHDIFSSDVVNGGITIADRPMEERLPMFIAQDPPKHNEQRKIVSPIVGPGNLSAMTATIRKRTQRVLDSLPRGETFDWVDKVSIELTTQMLATLFDFPFEDRRLLTWWSNVATSIPGVDGVVPSEEAYRMELGKCLAGSFTTHSTDGSARVPGQCDLAHRRWQRYDSELHERRPARRAEQSWHLPAAER
jgi:cytochrome P450